MDFLKKIRTPILVGILAFLAGRFLTEPKTKIVEKEKIVYKEKKEEKKDTRIVTRKREEKKPDGTVITDTTTSEESKTETKTDILVSKEKSKTTERGSGVIVGAMIMDDLDDLRSKDHYGVMVAVPLSNKSYIFSTVDLEKRFGIGLALEF
ncbi:hypothetical protein EBU94_06105 [bacterium]|nr:hypothetical protein [bacterium]